VTDDDPWRWIRPLTAVASETGISLPADVLDGPLPTSAFKNPPPY
jgi:hypothetical protein